MISNYAKWVELKFPALLDKTIATISMEGYIPELSGDAREANTKGGLGVYFGDKLEGLHSIGIEMAFGCMPMYQKRLVQKIVNGSQCIEYKKVCYDDQPACEVIGHNEKPLQFDVWGINPEKCMEEKQYHVKVYCVDRGGTVLYMFWCPEVFDVLYPDNVTHPGTGREHRFLQETVFGECVHALMRTLGLKPDVLLANEGHVAVAAAITRGDDDFESTAIVYTNHTVVPAGLEVYDIQQLAGNDIARARYIMRFPGRSWQQLWDKFVIGRDGKNLIDFSRGALQICNAANAVSAEHADVTYQLFPDCDKEIIPVLNGSGDTWVMDGLLEMEFRGGTPMAEELVEIGKKGKKQAFDFIDERVEDMTDEHGNPIYDSVPVLDIDKPTVWLVRGLVDYKSQYPILKDIVHILCAERDTEVDTRWGKMNGLGMQVVVGGIASANSPQEGWIREFVKWAQSDNLKGKFVFVPGSDTNLLKMQAIGADILMNCPEPKMEACGTSDQRSARNGGINLAVRSGGPPEYIMDGINGMLVGPYENREEFFDVGQKDILDKLAILSKMYYDSNDGCGKWMDMKLKSYLSSSKVTAMAMEKRYARVYLEAIQSREKEIQKKEYLMNVLPDSQCHTCQTGIIYEMVPRDYKSKDGRVGLSVIYDDLDYIAACGVEYIYLVGVMRHTGRPFEVLDPFDLDEKTGTFDDLQKFLEKAHSLGVKVVLDWMANQHVAKESKLCSEHPEWFLYTDGAEGNYYFDSGLKLIAGRYRDPHDKSLGLVSATDEVCIKSFPRRWTTLAQPDLSHPQLQEHGVEVGRFWLEKGFDGFRVDAALATFPDQIKHNWGLDVEENLSKVFIRKMRQVDPNCFIMFEGFERQGELLDLAGNMNCAVYNWKPRNFTTEALQSSDKTGNLIEFLKQVEVDQEDTTKYINLGPEHDAFDFVDPWATLSYSQRQMMYLLYQFLPGYCIVFNGQLDGQQHHFKSLPEKSEEVPRPTDEKSVKHRVGKWLFNLRQNYSTINNGYFKVPDYDNHKLVVASRYNNNEIIIAVINPDTGAQEVKIDIREIVEDQLAGEDFSSLSYIHEVIQPTEKGKGYHRDVRDKQSIHKFLEDLLYVGINAGSWQLIRLCLAVDCEEESYERPNTETNVSNMDEVSQSDIESSVR